MSQISFPNPITGLYDGSNGGTEFMYRELMARLPEKYKDSVQLICSRPNVLLDKPRILWNHDHSSDPPQNYKSREYRDQFFKHVFVSHVQQMLFSLSTGMEYNESIVIRNAITPIEDHQKPMDGTINLIYHTTPHRGLELLVPAFIEIVKANPEIKLHLDVYSSFSVYGWNDRDIPFENLFSICKNHPNIKYHGFQPNSVIREALKKAHIFAYPNIWPETSSIAAIEALSAGCLVVYPRYEGLIETVGDFGIGYTYTDDHQTHINRFANILHQVVNRFNSGTFQAATFKAKHHINQYYSWDNRMPEWIELYESIEKWQKNQNIN